MRSVSVMESDSCMLSARYIDSFRRRTDHRHSSPSHRESLEVMANLAVIHAQMGESYRAKVIETRVLMELIKILGDNDSSTLSSMANLAVRYSQLGEYQHGKELETTVLEKQTQILGEDHPDTLRSMGNLAAR
jgi:hypothetical protein